MTTPGDVLDQLIVSIAHEINDASVIGLGLGTTVPLAAALLAQHTHAPNALLFLSPACAYVRGLRAMPLSLHEWVATDIVERPSIHEVFVRQLHRTHVEFFRPAQLDRRGRFNVTFVQRPDGRKLRLPGGAGIPDVTALISDLLLYVPRHDKRTFVEHLDFVTGGGTAGTQHAAVDAGSRPRLVLTDLGVFGFDADGLLHAHTLHQDVTAADVAQRTGFPVEITNAGVTEPATDDELRLLGELDPLGFRHLEALPAAARRERLRAAFARETELVTTKREGR